MSEQPRDRVTAKVIVIIVLVAGVAICLAILCGVAYYGIRSSPGEAATPIWSSTDPDGDYILDSAACVPLVLSVSQLSQRLSDSPSIVCAGWRDEYRAAINAVDSCWSNLPTPADENLKASQRAFQEAIDHFQKAVNGMDAFCRGAGSLDRATHEIEAANEAMSRAGDYLNAYTANHD